MNTKMNNFKQQILKYGIAVMLFILGILGLSQCTVISFYPLYTPDELVLDDRIIGTWMSRLTSEEVSSDSLVWEISFKDKKWKKKVNNNLDKGSEQIPNKLTYTLKMYPADNIENAAIYDIHIVKLENGVFLDFLLEDVKLDNEFAGFHLMTVHTFAKLEIGDEIIVKWFDDEFLQSLIDDKKIRIRHERREESSLLTAKPKELQRFINKYSNNKDAYFNDLSFALSPYSKEI